LRDTLSFKKPHVVSNCSVAGDSSPILTSISLAS
jgi:hypothetical protein